MPSLVIPLIAAAAFTAGGYAILKLERQAEPIGDWLFTVFVIVAVATGALTVGRVIAAHHPRPTVASLERGRPQAPAWTGGRVFPASVPMN